MKYMVTMLLWALLWACSAEKKVEIRVKNPVALNRQKETVEVEWQSLFAALKGLHEKNVVVTDASGKEVASQVVFEGGTEPRKLIFQADIAPEGEAVYTIQTGKPQEYAPQAFGRYVPERMDDYAWENNLVGHRMYGPALEATGEISNGIDVWVKKTGELLINEWYRTGDYHKDHGKGMDCYKVGRTLGAGALAPYVDGNIILGNNYVKQQTLDNGPLRVSFQLEYAPFRAGEFEVTETRTISLDANSYFNRIADSYAGVTGEMEVVAGIVTRPEPADTLMEIEKGIVGYWEPQNRDNGEDNGHVAVGIIFPGGAKQILNQSGHVLAIGDYRSGQPFVYYMGSAWSKGGVETSERWFKILEQEREKLANPLKVEIIK